MSGFSVPGSTAGNGFGLNGVVGGLGALLQGLVQGHQMKLQNEQAKQNLTDDRMKSGLNTFSMLSGLSQAQLNSPEMVPYLQNFQKQYGNTLPPVLNAQGKVNSGLFNKSLAEFAGTPLYTQIMQQPPGQFRDQLVSQAPLSDEDKKSLAGAPREYSSPVQTNASNQMWRINNEIVTQALDMSDPKNAGLIDDYNHYADIVGASPFAGVATGGVADSTVARNNAQAGASHAAALRSAADTARINKQTAWMDKLNQAHVSLFESETGWNRERIAELPTQVAAQVRNSMASYGRYQDEHTKLLNDVTSFKSLGVTNAGTKALLAVSTQLTSATKAAGAYAATADNAARSFGTMAFGGLGPPDLARGEVRTPNEARYEQLVSAAQNAHARYNQMLIDNRGMSASIQKFQKRVLSAGGGPSSWKSADPIPKDLTTTPADASGGSTTAPTTKTEAQLAAWAKTTHMTMNAARAYAKANKIEITP